MTKIVDHAISASSLRLSRGKAMAWNGVTQSLSSFFFSCYFSIAFLCVSKLHVCECLKIQSRQLCACHNCHTKTDARFSSAWLPSPIRHIHIRQIWCECVRYTCWFRNNPCVVVAYKPTLGQPWIAGMAHGSIRIIYLSIVFIGAYIYIIICIYMCEQEGETILYMSMMISKWRHTTQEQCQRYFCCVCH